MITNHHTTAGTRITVAPWLVVPTATDTTCPPPTNDGLFDDVEHAADVEMARVLMSDWVDELTDAQLGAMITEGAL